MAAKVKNPIRRKTKQRASQIRRDLFSSSSEIDSPSEVVSLSEVESPSEVAALSEIDSPSEVASLSEFDFPAVHYVSGH